MRKLLHKILLKPVLWASNKYSSRPDRQRIYTALSELLSRILDGEKMKGLVVPFNVATGKFIIFSDQHKGCKDGADDFLNNEANYLAALDYYHRDGFHFVTLGDSEELWENTLGSVKKAQQPSFEKEARFIPGNAFIKIFGNHDLYWDNDPLASINLKEVYGYEVPVYEAVVLETSVNNKPIRIFCTHGHQGDAVSDGNWFSKFFVSTVWAPLQAYLNINPNTPAYNAALKTAHNIMMYEWSAAQQDLLLVTGHTHQPVFESLTHIERLYRQLLFARQLGDKSLIDTLQQEILLRKFRHSNISEDYLKLKPSYFNSGCCCYDDGGITGIEISDGVLRLIQWKEVGGKSDRVVLEESSLAELWEGLQ
ncbi:MAG TPA: metallophosphoesterase [Flavisolibacter sp.]|nr:metallophosphoesterase [Flavisolibacter sp.]